MTELVLFETVEVELIQHVGGDASVVQAARVSTANDEAAKFADAQDKDKGLINYLMREWHGTPFEHNLVTFRVHAPIMVFREWHRHRIQSYNEQSGRYTVFKPEFYVPGKDRPLINIGTSAKPEMGPADQALHDKAVARIIESYEESWSAYQDLLSWGIANEVSRLPLPVGIMSSMYASTNLRAWLHFLSLRTQDEGAVHLSRPQREIAMAAEQVESHLNDLFPITMEAWNKNGRVAP